MQCSSKQRAHLAFEPAARVDTQSTAYKTPPYTIAPPQRNMSARRVYQCNCSRCKGGEVSKSTYLRHRNRYYDQQTRQWLSQEDVKSSASTPMALLLEADSCSDEESFFAKSALPKRPCSRGVSSASDCGSCFGTDSIVDFTSSDSKNHSFAQVAQIDVGTTVLC